MHVVGLNINFFVNFFILIVNGQKQTFKSILLKYHDVMAINYLAPDEAFLFKYKIIT